MKRVVSALALLFTIALAVAVWARQAPATDSATPAQIEQRVEKFLREFYAWGKDFQVKVNPPKTSSIPDLYEVPVQISYQGQTDHAMVFVSQDGRYMIRGSLDNLMANPFAANRSHLDLANHPFSGPSKACVNVVEFSDFECPHCKELAEVLKQVEPKFPQVRFTYFDFPLDMHPWAMTAALAGRCAYAQSPADYQKFRSAIFGDQEQITPDNASDQLMNLAAQSGLDKSSMLACMSSPDTRKEVEADRNLGGELHVDSTPTVFVNGRPMVGGNEPLLEQFINYELNQCSTATADKN